MFLSVSHLPSAEKEIFSQVIKYLVTQDFRPASSPENPWCFKNGGNIIEFGWDVDAPRESTKDMLVRVTISYDEESSGTFLFDEFLKKFTIDVEEMPSATAQPMPTLSRPSDRSGGRGLLNSEPNGIR